MGFVLNWRGSPLHSTNSQKNHGQLTLLKECWDRNKQQQWVWSLLLQQHFIQDWENKLTTEFVANNWDNDELMREWEAKIGTQSNGADDKTCSVQLMEDEEVLIE